MAPLDVSPGRREDRAIQTRSAVGLTGSGALLVGYALGVRDPTALVAIGAVLGAVPAAAQLVVANGGIRGLVRLGWRGRQRTVEPGGDGPAA